MSLFNGIICGLKMLGVMMSLFDGIIYPWVIHVVLKVLEVLDTSVWKKILVGFYQDLISILRTLHVNLNCIKVNFIYVETIY